MIPSTFLLIGIRNSGKSILLDIAKLAVRDLSEPLLLYLQHLNSTQEFTKLKNSLLRSFILLPTNLINYNICPEKAVKCEHCSSILMHKKPSVTLFHFHMSEVSINKFTDEFPILIRDHALIARQLPND